MRHWSEVGVGANGGVDADVALVDEGVIVVVTVLGSDEELAVVADAEDVLNNISTCVLE
jgi:hypothetical protein